MTDIDQELYDAVMAKRVPYLRNQGEFHFKDGYAKGFDQAAKVAARIAAERQPVAYIGVDTTVPLPPLSDEETADLRDIAHEYQPVSDEEGGKIVRDVWIAYAKEHGDTKSSHLTEWDELPEYDKEVDRRIFRAVRAAERQPVPVSIEELDIQFLDAYDRVQDDEKRDCDFDMNGLDAGRRAGIRAVLAALGPAVPVIPEGWKCYNATFVPAEIAHDGVTWYRATIGKADFSASTEGTGPTWLDALTAAIEAAKERDHE